jgi:primary-amine oxidase
MISGVHPISPSISSTERQIEFAKMGRLSSTILPVFLGSLTLAAGLVRQQPKFSPRVEEVLGRRAEAGVCGAQPETTAPRQNIWAGLTNQEMADAISFLYSSKELNLTKDGGR